MISSIAIENFKGIADKVVVPIRPITLLFGPNSAGKSTIMHAVHYAREVLERHNLDADRTIAGGDCVNLGGFRELVHRKDKERQIRLRFDLDLSRVAWHEEFPVDEFVYHGSVGTGAIDLSALGLDVMSGWVEMTIGFDDPEGDADPVVLEYSVGLDGRQLASLDYWPDYGKPDRISRGALLTLNPYHPALGAGETGADSVGPVDFYFPQFCDLAMAVYFDPDAEPASDAETQGLAAGQSPPDAVVSVLKSPGDFEPGTIQRGEKTVEGNTIRTWVGKCRDTGKLAICAVSYPRVPGLDDAEAKRTLAAILSLADRPFADVMCSGMTDAMPTLDRPLRLQFGPMRFGEDESDDDSTEDRADEVRFLEQLLSRLIVGPGRFLRDQLAGFRYVGPIRAIPPPDHVPPRYPDDSRWASGLAAWDLFMAPGSEGVAEGVSEWLWDDDRLGTGCRLVVKRGREIERYLQERMLRAEWEEGEPSDLLKDILAELETMPERRRVYVRDMEKGVDLSPSAVGLGIVQVVPVLAAVLAPGADVVQVEQPELHLHPTQQAVLGDLMIEGALAEPRKVLLVETHSEHLILRILRRIRQTHQGRPHNERAVRPGDVIALYVESKDGQTSAFEIGIGEDGEFLQPWPDKFFEQDYEERFA
ncbi:MAG: AAA family ATPase [Thermoguttaceae bacterium]|jgi:hypothetical protein|nr:AAA family ATPase [Thermoguttaceae bacterium]